MCIAYAVIALMRHVDEPAGMVEPRRKGLFLTGVG